MRMEREEFDGLKGRGDEVYEAILEAHKGLSDAQSAALDARLVLLLANAVNDPDAVLRILREARAGLQG